MLSVHIALCFKLSLVCLNVPTLHFSCKVCLNTSTLSCTKIESIVQNINKCSSLWSSEMRHRNAFFSLELMLFKCTTEISLLGRHLQHIYKHHLHSYPDLVILCLEKHKDPVVKLYSLHCEDLVLKFLFYSAFFFSRIVSQCFNNYTSTLFDQTVSNL